MTFRGAIACCLATAGFLTPRASLAEDALETLAHIEAFAFGGIGVAGTPSEGEIAFREILARSTAAADFRKLLADGNRQAKCYALVALRKLDPDRASSFAEPFFRSNKSVKTIAGCMIADLPRRSVVTNIDRGNYDRDIDRKMRP